VNDEQWSQTMTTDRFAVVEVWGSVEAL